MPQSLSKTRTAEVVLEERDNISLICFLVGKESFLTLKSDFIVQRFCVFQIIWNFFFFFFSSLNKVNN